MFIPLRDNMPKHGVPVITVLLIVLNCLIFVLAEGTQGKLESTVAKYGAVPTEIMHPGTKCIPTSTTDETPPRCGPRQQLASRGGDYPPSWITVITANFLHGSFLHLAGNMLFLFVFGWALEGAMGGAKFFGLYMASGIAAVLGHTLSDPAGMYPMVGASGAIAGVMGAYLMLFPRARIFSLFIVFPCEVRAIWVLLTWLLYQAVTLREMEITQATGGVAVFAHLAGFAVGAGLVMLMMSKDAIAEQRQIAEWVTRVDEAAEKTPPPMPAAVFQPSGAPGQPQFVAQAAGPQYFSGGVQVAAPPGYVPPSQQRYTPGQPLPPGYFTPQPPAGQAPAQPPPPQAPPSDPFAPPQL